METEKTINVEHKDYFGMFTDEGNRKVKALFNEVMKLPISTTTDELYKVLRDGMNEIDKEHAEIWDTDTREHIVSRIENATCFKDLSIYFG